MNRNREFHPLFIFPGLTTCTQNNWLKLADHCSELFATNNPCLRPELSLPFCCDNHILLLFNPALFLATQIASMSLNMKPWKKGALYLIFCKKKKGIRWSVSEHGRPLLCQAYSHLIFSALRFIKLQPVSSLLTEEITSTWRRRGGFPAGPYPF